MRRGPVLLALLAALTGAAGCETIDEILNGSSDTSADRLELQSITIESDHPVDAATPGGAAAATNGEMVRFFAVGHFINLDEGDAPEERTLTGAVLWTSTDPALGVPASDGRMLVTGSGTVTIVARTPAAGEIPALESNGIVLAMTLGTGG